MTSLHIVILIFFFKLNYSITSILTTTSGSTTTDAYLSRIFFQTSTVFSLPTISLFFFASTCLLYVLIVFLIIQDNKFVKFTGTLLLVILLIWVECTGFHYDLTTYYDSSFFQNMLLWNGLNEIHPILLYLSLIFSTAYAFIFLSLNLVRRYNRFPLLAVSLISVSTTGLFFILTLILGAWWAFQESSWNGWWAWDSSEFLLLMFIIFILFLSHLKIWIKHSRWLSKVYVVLWFVGFLYKSTVITLLGLSLHTFFSTSNYHLLNYSLVFFAFSGFCFFVFWCAFLIKIRGFYRNSNSRPSRAFLDFYFNLILLVFLWMTIFSNYHELYFPFQVLLFTFSVLIILLVKFVKNNFNLYAWIHLIIILMILINIIKIPQSIVLSNLTVSNYLTLFQYKIYNIAFSHDITYITPESLISTFFNNTFIFKFNFNRLGGAESIYTSFYDDTFILNNLVESLIQFEGVFLFFSVYKWVFMLFITD